MKKYELTAETRVVYGKTLHRIRALVAFSDVSAGSLGGWIEKEENLSHDGDAWVYNDACVYDNAWVGGNACVCDNARIEKGTHLLQIGGIGSRDDITTFFRSKDKGISVSCGCFLGTIQEFAEKVKETHGDSKHAKVYLAAIELAKLQLDDVVF